MRTVRCSGSLRDGWVCHTPPRTGSQTGVKHYLAATTLRAVTREIFTRYVFTAEVHFAKTIKDSSHFQFACTGLTRQAVLKCRKLGPWNLRKDPFFEIVESRKHTNFLLIKSIWDDKQMLWLFTKMHSNSCIWLLNSTLFSLFTLYDYFWTLDKKSFLVSCYLHAKENSAVAPSPIFKVKFWKHWLICGQVQ